MECTERVSGLHLETHSEGGGDAVHGDLAGIVIGSAQVDLLRCGGSGLAQRRLERPIDQSRDHVRTGPPFIQTTMQSASGALLFDGKQLAETELGAGGVVTTAWTDGTTEPFVSDGVWPGLPNF